MTTCQVQVSDGGRMMSSHTCGRKLSGSDDYPEMCGLHAASLRRALARERARQESADSRKAELDAADERVRNLNSRLGIAAVAQTAMPTHGIHACHSRPTGNVIVPLDVLEALAERIRQGKDLLP